MKTPFPFRFRLPLFLVFGAGLVVVLPLLFPRGPAPAQAAARPTTNAVDVAALQVELALVKSQLPDQAHGMADVGYHFANLWFAGKQKNWPLAKFFLDETRSHLNWAVRLKPVRKVAAGDLDLRNILQAVENTQLAGVKKAVEDKDAEKFVTAYRQTLEACYACHKASEKPYLRPQIPGQSAAPIINFDPDAKWPE
jgi:hypothetical protein